MALSIPGGYTDAADTTLDQKNSRLEFTLRDGPSNTEREVDVKAIAMPTSPMGQPPTKWQAALAVDFRWPDPSFLGDAWNNPGGDEPSLAQADNNFDIYVECSVKYADSAHSVENTEGVVYLWQHTGCGGSGGTTNQGSWVLAGNYYFHAPQSVGPGGSGGDNRYRARVHISSAFALDSTFLDCSAGEPRTRLKLVHLGDAQFTSSYDLVQIVPQGYSGIPTEESMAPMSDMNYDSTVDSQDLAHFVTDWMDGSAGGDANLDGELDDEDIDTFLNAYLTGS